LLTSGGHRQLNQLSSLALFLLFVSLSPISSVFKFDKSKIYGIIDFKLKIYLLLKSYLMCLYHPEYNSCDQQPCALYSQIEGYIVVQGPLSF